MKTKTHWLMWITTTRVGRGKVWPGCAHTLDLSGISYLSLATFRQCSPLWPGLFRSFFVLFFVCFCFVCSFVCFGGKRSWYSLVFQLSNVFEPKLNTQQCLICEAFFFFFFRNALSTADRGVSAPTTSLWLHPIDPLPLATVVFGLQFFKGNPWNENSDSFVSFSQQPAAAHSLGMLHFRFVVTEPCGSVVLWRHGGHVTETRDFQLQTTQLVTKRRVCFLSNQHFYVPQENFHVSNEQRVC